MRVHDLARSLRFTVALASLSLCLGAGCSSDTTLKITRLSRSTGSPGETLNIYGSGFQSGGRKDVRVFFGTKKANVLGFKGDDQIVVKVPGGVDFGKTVDIKVVFEPGGELTYENAFTYAKPEVADPDEMLGGSKDEN